MVKEIKNTEIEWEKVGAFYMHRLGHDDANRVVVAVYSPSDVLSYGKLQIFQNAAIIVRGEGEERIRIFRISGRWIKISRIAKLNDDGINYDVNYLVAYDYSDDEEERDAIIVIQGKSVLVEYTDGADGYITTAHVDDGRITEFPGLGLEVVKAMIE